MIGLMKTARTLGFAACTLAATSHATLIDFRGDMFSGADKQKSFTTTVDGVQLTLEAEKTGHKLYQDSEDGIGLRGSYEKDEIEGQEILKLEFSKPVMVNSLNISDLFYESRKGHSYQETGWYWMDGGEKIMFIADMNNLPSPQTNGEQTLQVGKIATTLYFSAPGKNNMRGKHEDHEFSLAGVDVSVAETKPIPEPSTMGLMGLALLGIGVWMRRKK